MKRIFAVGIAGWIALACVSAPSYAQESAVSQDPAEQIEALKGQLEGMTEQVQALVADVDKLKKIKVSGYVQARWETAENKSDTVAVTGPGPTVTPANNERFYIRRGRLKFTYDSSPLSQAVVYFDGASSGSSINARLLEAYVTLLDPWTVLHQHALTVGQMSVPFGYEVERSSSVRELPERSRAENVLFPGGRDRGVKFVSQWTPQFETQVGIFNGAGISSAEFPTSDPTRRKDLIARVRYAQGMVDGAVSWYGGRATTALSGADVETDKTRLGVDVQSYYELPALGGGSLRAEYFGGKDVNADSVKRLTTVPTTGGRVLVANADPAHLATDFQGGYVMWVQNLGERFQAVARYDRYDPNVDLDHDQYERVSLGTNFFYDGFTRITLSYDLPMTDVAATGGRFVDPHDNLWTVQVQHKF
ncbi:MAG: porin [Candidatus Eisenbacteria bacterium]